MRLYRFSAGIALLTMAAFATSHGAANAAVITVTTTADTIASDGQCSLREAVIAANTDQAAGGCASGSGSDRIVFAPTLPRPVTIALARPGAGEDAAATGDLDVLGQLKIEGDGAAAIMVEANGGDRVLEVRPGAAVTVAGLTLGGGAAAANGGGGVLVGPTAALTLTDVVLTGNAGGGATVRGTLSMARGSILDNEGGGLLIDGGGATLTNVTVGGNTGGPGVLNQGAGNLAMTGGDVRNNAGGGVDNHDARAVLTGLVIRDNGGSGVSNTGAGYASLDMSLSTLSGNHAVYGAGLSNTGTGARADVRTTSFLDNTAEAGGGAVYNNGILGMSTSVLARNQARTGGGLDHAGGNLALVNDTISGNRARDNGGGLYNRSAAVLTHVTFYGDAAGGAGTGPEIFNDTASLSLQNTLIEGGPDNCTNSEGFVTSLGYNLETGDTCGLRGPGDRANTSAQLAPLQDNGGPTWTHALAAVSPAVDAAGAAACTAADQRGVARPQGGGCDIGAFELTAGKTVRIYAPLLSR